MSPKRETFNVKAQVLGWGVGKKKKIISSEERRESRKMLRADQVEISRN